MFRVNVFNINFLSQFRFVSLANINKFIIYSYSLTYNILMTVNKNFFFIKLENTILIFLNNYH